VIVYNFFQKSWESKMFLYLIPGGKKDLKILAQEHSAGD
jgi:hypothetical protein